MEELDEDSQLADALTTFEQELVAEEETFMAAIGIKKLALPKPRVPARPPKPQPPQSYEIDQRVVANWNGQLTLAKVRTPSRRARRRCHVATAARYARSQLCRFYKRSLTCPRRLRIGLTACTSRAGRARTRKAFPAPGLCLTT